ncbi:MAG: N-acetylglucosamine-6-phosphate deacetylase [Ginsengibacter sp.]
MIKAYSANKIFTGQSWRNNSAVIIENDIVANVVSLNNLPADIPVMQHTFILAPAFIDIQIYGASSKLFSAYPTSDTLYKMKEHCNNGGTKYFLPTIATNTTEVFKKGIDAIKEYWRNGGTGVPGLHIEGPWINKEKRGAHIESLIHAPQKDEVAKLLEYGKGIIKMITLAPEICSEKIIDLIKSYGIIISAGHSNATYSKATVAFKKNIHVATHLFNAMSALHHREPGLPAAIMLNNEVMASIVADGYHVDFAMICLAKKIMGNRLFLITDAVTETKEGPYQHKRSGDRYLANNILSGSALTMIQAVKNCIDKCNISLEEALRMASLYPAQILQLDNKAGKIETGFNADFVLLNKELEVTGCV